MPGRDIVYFSVVAAAAYLVFQFFVMHAAGPLDGDCLYRFWLPSNSPLVNPFWLFVATATVLALLALGRAAGLVRARPPVRWMALSFYLVAFVAMGWWLYDLGSFFEAMQYERGIVSAAEYFDGDPHSPWFLGGDLRVCGDGT